MTEVLAAGRPSQPRLAPLAWRPVLLVVGVAAAIHLAVANRFGWHRDEFYYVISGRHLAFGYVDQPPLVPLLARLAADLPGGVVPLRVLAIAANLGCILLGARLAAEFGGRRWAQTITAAAIAVSTVFVAATALFGTTVTDQLVWVALLVLVARALRLGTTWSWLAAGLVAGIGLENKDTVLVLLAGITIALFVTRRDVLRTPAPWLAGGLAILIALPNVIWNALHGWPQIKMAAVESAAQGGPLGSLVHLPLAAILYGGVGMILLWVSGARWLASPAGRDQRWLLIVVIAVVVLLTASGGKPYYPVPLFAGLFAAGAVRYQDMQVRNWRIWAGIALTAVISLVVSLPVLPEQAASAVRGVNPELAETYSWPSFVDQVHRVSATLPPDTVIYTSNYGEAGSLTILGPAVGVHNPIYSGHNSYTYWGPPPGTPSTVLCIGEFTANDLRHFWSHVTELAPITLPNGLQDEETAKHAAIYLCQQPVGTWAQLWPYLRHFD